MPADRRHSISWLLVVAWLLLSLSPGVGVVLCIGYDGHVQVEAAHADSRCCDDPSGDAPSADVRTSNPQHVGVCCTDISLARAASDFAPEGGMGRVPLVAVFVPFDAGRAVSESTSGGVIGDFSPRGVTPTTAPGLRTDVLRL